MGRRYLGFSVAEVGVKFIVLQIQPAMSTLSFSACAIHGCTWWHVQTLRQQLPAARHAGYIFTCVMPLSASTIVNKAFKLNFIAARQEDESFNHEKPEGRIGTSMHNSETLKGLILAVPARDEILQPVANAVAARQKQLPSKSSATWSHFTLCRVPLGMFHIAPCAHIPGLAHGLINTKRRVGCSKFTEPKCLFSGKPRYESKRHQTQPKRSQFVIKAEQ